MDISISEKLAGYFCNLRYENLPDSLIYQSKTFFLDWLGSAFAGRSQEPIRIMISAVNEMNGYPLAKIIPTRRGHLPIIAALVNGASSHVMEMDDLHREGIFHPAAPIMPAVFAAAEEGHVSGAQLIVGIVAGYEIGIRTALAVGKDHYKYWHTTATCGTFGAAAGAAKILGLEPEPFAWALGSAGTQSAGLWEFLADGAMSKHLHPGKAAMNGLLSALLAKKGFTGARRIFEGERGFLKATSKDHNVDILVSGLGETFHMARNSLKYFASCGHTHPAIEAALKAWQKAKSSVESIQSVTVKTYRQALDLLQSVEARTPYLAKFSIPFCVAAAICFGHVDVDDFTEENIKRPEIVKLMKLVSLESDPELTAEYPEKWSAIVEIELTSGERYEGICEYPKGDPQNPLSEEELVRKFDNLTGDALTQAEKDRIVEMVLNLEKVRDVSRII